MKLVIAYEGDHDIFDEQMMDKKTMRYVLESFLAGDKRILVPLEVEGASSKSVVNTDYVVSVGLIEEGE